MAALNLGNMLLNMHVGAKDPITTSTNNNRKATNDNTKVADLMHTSTKDNKDSFNDKLSKIKEKKSSSVANRNDERETKIRTKDTNAKKKCEAEVVEEVDEERVAEVVMQLIAETLNQPIEHIANVLEEMGISSIDLLDEGNFSNFLTELFGEMDMETLLANSDELKGIGKLFTQIEKMASFEGGKLVETISENTLEEGKIVASNLETVVTELTGIEETQSVEHLELSEIISQIEVNLEPESEPADLSLGIDHLNAHFSKGLGLTVPIENFTKTLGVNIQNHAIGHTINSPKEVIIAHQVIDKIDISTIDQMKEIKLQLSPRELGELTIRLLEKNGVISADISVDNEKAKAIMQNEIEVLKQALQEQGLEVSDIQVDIRQNDTKSQMEQQRQKSSKRIQEIIDKQFDELDEEVEEVVPVASTSEFDYMV